MMKIYFVLFYDQMMIIFLLLIVEDQVKHMLLLTDLELPFWEKINLKNLFIHFGIYVIQCINWILHLFISQKYILKTQFLKP